MALQRPHLEKKSDQGIRNCKKTKNSVIGVTRANKLSCSYRYIKKIFITYNRFRF